MENSDFTHMSPGWGGKSHFLRVGGSQNKHHERLFQIGRVSMSFFKYLMHISGGDSVYMSVRLAPCSRLVCVLASVHGRSTRSIRFAEVLAQLLKGILPLSPVGIRQGILEEI